MIAHESHAGTLEITMNGGKGNLLSSRDLEQLWDLIGNAQSDSLIQGVIITGTGHSFSAGLDLTIVGPASEDLPMAGVFLDLDRLLMSLFRFPKPFVAAINGHAIGAGFLVQLCSDCSIVSDNERIKMGLPELLLGLTLDPLMSHLARHGFSSDRALQNFLYLGDLIGPNQARLIGVVDEIVTSESLMSTARDRVRRLLRGGLTAFSLTKQALRNDTIRKMEKSLAAHSHTVFDDLLPQMRRSRPT